MKLSECQVGAGVGAFVIVAVVVVVVVAIVADAVKAFWKWTSPSNYSNDWLKCAMALDLPKIRQPITVVAPLQQMLIHVVSICAGAIQYIFPAF